MQQQPALSNILEALYLMTFTIRQLEVFVQAAADENFRATADRLGITQPTISNHISALEREVGGPLFDRQRGSSAKLSPKGRDLLERAKLLLSEAGKVNASRFSQAENPSSLTIIVGPQLQDHIIRPALPRYYALPEMPDLNLISMLLGEEAFSLLRCGKADVGFFNGDRLTAKGLNVDLLRPVAVGLYAAPDLADSVGGDRNIINTAPFLMAPLNSAHNDWLCKIFLGAGINPINIAARSQFSDVIKQLAIEGRGLGVLFDDDAWPHVEKGELTRIPIDFVSGYRLMITRPEPLHPTLSAALAFWRALLKTS
jgi:Transcriptional regulator